MCSFMVHLDLHVEVVHSEMVVILGGLSLGFYCKSRTIGCWNDWTMTKNITLHFLATMRSVTSCQVVMSYHLVLSCRRRFPGKADGLRFNESDYTGRRNSGPGVLSVIWAIFTIWRDRCKWRNKITNIHNNNSDHNQIWVQPQVVTRPENQYENQCSSSASFLLWWSNKILWMMIKLRFCRE